MIDELADRIIQIVEKVLNDGRSEIDEKLTLKLTDSMETVADWDSLNFMEVFLAINEEFVIEPEFDDAIHYISIDGLYKYLKERME